MSINNKFFILASSANSIYTDTFFYYITYDEFVLIV